MTTPEGQRIRERYNPLSEVTGPTINWIKTIGQLSHLWHLDKMKIINNLTFKAKLKTKGITEETPAPIMKNAINEMILPGKRIRINKPEKFNTPLKKTTFLTPN